MGDNPHISGPIQAKGINALLLNLIIPGLGTLLYGRTEIGAGQIALAGLGIPMFWFSWILALIMIVSAWIWSAVVGFQIMSAPSSS